MNAINLNPVLVGQNRLGQTTVARREGPGEWSGKNLATGAKVQAEYLNDMPGATSHWGVTRTGPRGVESYNDFTVRRDPESNQVKLFDLNRSGFKPLAAE